jgi:hypothetical protein
VHALRPTLPSGPHRYKVNGKWYISASPSKKSVEIYTVPYGFLEPISKSSEEDNEAGELDEAEVAGVIFPADEGATLCADGSAMTAASTRRNTAMNPAVLPALQFS